MIKAIVSKTKNEFTGVAFEGEDAYYRNVTRDKEFIIPVLVPSDIEPEDLLYLLKEKKRHILRVSQEVEVETPDGVFKVKHRKINKGRKASNG